ncbi:MAG: hypothetical protein BRD52_08095 [Bacteroidetes bacterium SW_4_67_19]|nr:MAG: hypothetical protein BRD52_08095 [Bacteroidetes bacterium SW_4_67_19]
MQKRSLLSAALLALLFAAAPASGQDDVVYVDSSASSENADGTSWPRAFPDLQRGLAAAAAGDEIWVARGTYRPDDGPRVPDGKRDTSFVLVPGVGVYGGFDGDETERAGRTADPEANGTVLSGDLAGNDANDSPPNRADNASFVIVTNARHEAATILDGFTISGAGTGSNPTPPFPNESAVRNAGGSPTLANLLITENATPRGAGMRNTDGGAPTLTNVTFDGNDARFDGAGFYSESGRPTLTEVTFVGNSNGEGSGGGMYVGTGAPVLTRVVFERNGTAGASGGGLFASGDSQPVLENVTFTENFAVMGGGGMANRGMATLENVTFEANEAGDGLGGGMYNLGAATLVDVTFRGNSSDNGGGGMAHDGARSLLINVTFHANAIENPYGRDYGGALSVSGPLTLANTLFYDNEVPAGNNDDPSSLGGAVYVTDGAAARFVNATFASNRAAGSGGALFVADSSEAVVRNSILWKNRADGSANQIATDSLPASVADVDTSLVEGGYDGSASARPDFIVDADPQFEDRSGGDLRVLTDGAPVLDRGARRYLPPDSLDLDADGDTTEKLPLDLAGAERFIDNNEDADPEVDLGAYEAPAGVTPVELAAFTAARLGDEPAAALLRWRTVSETSNDGFVIEHRSAASDSTWQRAGFVEGAGTTQDPQQYRFRVSDLAPGTHAFRLRQRDLDGATQRHRPVEVHIGMSERFVLEAPYPNPARGTGAAATVAFGSQRGEPVRLLLYDALGRQVRTLWRGTPAAGRLKRVRIDAAGLSSGTYFLRLVGAEGGAAKTQSLTLVR